MLPGKSLPWWVGGCAPAAEVTNLVCGNLYTINKYAYMPMLCLRERAAFHASEGDNRYAGQLRYTFAPLPKTPPRIRAYNEHRISSLPW